MKFKAALACIAVVGAFAAYQTNELRLAELALVEHQNASLRARARAVDVAVEEGNRRTQEVQKATNEADKARRIAEENAADARRAADSLRKQLAALSARLRAAASDPAPPVAGPGVPGSDALDLLTGMLARHSAELAEVGGFADQLRTAGTTCERSYDALTP